MHRPARHNPGVAIDQHPVLHVHIADKARAVHPAAGLAPPAVLHPQVFPGGAADRFAEGALAAAVAAVQCVLHQLPRGDAQGLGQGVVKGCPLLLGKDGVLLPVQGFQGLAPHPGGAAVGQQHPGPAGNLLPLGGQPQPGPPAHRQKPHPCHPGAAQQVGLPGRHHRRRRQVPPQLALIQEQKVLPVHIAGVAVEGADLHHFSILFRVLHHLAALAVQALVPDGGKDLPFLPDAGFGRQVIDGGRRAVEQRKFHSAALLWFIRSFIVASRREKCNQRADFGLFCLLDNRQSCAIINGSNRIG